MPIVLERPRARNEAPETQQTGSVEPQVVNKRPAKSATRSVGPVPLINWMRGQKQYTLQDALNEVTPKISFPQLLDVSPRLRKELGELVRSSVPRARKRGKGKEPVLASNAALAEDTPVILTKAYGDYEVSCLFIDAGVGNKLVGNILVHCGAMLDLISQETAENLGLDKHVVMGLGMRLAGDSLVRLDYYVSADIIVAGGVARIKAYVVPVSVTYKVLLSRRWLKRVRGIGYHKSNILYIGGIDAVKRKVQGKPASKQDIELVRFFQQNRTELRRWRVKKRWMQLRCFYMSWITGEMMGKAMWKRQEIGNVSGCVEVPETKGRPRGVSGRGLVWDEEEDGR